MHGISSHSKEEITKVIENLFDKLALRFLGTVPKLSHKKHTLIGFEQNQNLVNLFVQSMNNRYLNSVEQDVVKGILSGAFSYIDILKNKTSNSVINKLEALARESRLAGNKIPQEILTGVITEELGKARSGLETIAASESTKARNLGMTMDVARAAAMEGDKDPVVAFAVIRDNTTCPTCIKLCLMPDKITPRLFRLSELSAGYYKRGEEFPSILGQHPRCRCSILYVPIGFGFDKKGHIGYIGDGHDEFSKQRS